MARRERDLRIKTFAIDEDIHTHCIAGPIAEQVAMDNTLKKHYQGVVSQTFVVDIGDPHDAAEVAGVMENHGGSSALEIAANGSQFAF